MIWSFLLAFQLYKTLLYVYSYFQLCNQLYYSTHYTIYSIQHIYLLLKKSDAEKLKKDNIFIFLMYVISQRRTIITELLREIFYYTPQFSQSDNASSKAEFIAALSYYIKMKFETTSNPSFCTSTFTIILLQ